MVHPPLATPSGSPPPYPNLLCSPTLPTRRLTRRYKCATLTHKNHGDVYDLMVNLATRRCCGVWSADEKESCDEAKVKFCLEGAVQRFDGGAPAALAPQRPCALRSPARRTHPRTPDQTVATPRENERIGGRGESQARSHTLLVLSRGG